MNSAVKEALERCFAEKRIVFWYDDGAKCREDFDDVELEGVEKLVLERNAFGIKYKVLSEKPEGKFLVYSPSRQPEPAEDWLYDLYLAGAAFSTDPVSMTLSELGLGEEVREIFSEQLMPFFKAESRRNEIVRLRDLMGGIRTREELELALLTAVCRVKTDVKLEYVLKALFKEYAEGKSDRLDELEKYGLLPALWNRLRKEHGYVSASTPGLVDYLNQLFQDAFYPQVRSESPRLTSAALSFFNDWKNDTKSAAVFKKISEEMAEKLHVADAIQSLEPDALGAVDTFRAVDEQIVKKLVSGAENGSLRPEDAARLIGLRKDGFFYDEFKEVYLACEAAARFFAFLSTLDFTSSDATDTIQRYAGSWYQVDQQYRLFLEHYNAAREEEGMVDLFGTLKSRVDGHYVNNYLCKQSVHFQTQLKDLDAWSFGDLKMQSRFWKDWIEPANTNVCVIISDALRYEIAAELKDSLESTHRYAADIKPMVGVLPSYTQLGMAALLPHTKIEFQYADESPKPVGSTVFVDGKSTMGLEARKAILESVDKPKATAIAYEKVMKMSKAECRQWQSSANVLYVYHDRIDRQGDKRETEEETPKAAREAVQDILKLIAKIGGDYRIHNFIVTADHGFLYQDVELDASQYVEDIVAEDEASVRKNRFLLGDSTMSDSSVLMNWTSDKLGMSDRVAVKVAKGIMRMRRAGSGVRFVHGGASLQEIVVPVVAIQHVRSGREDVVPVEADILVEGSGRITTNRFTVSVSQNAAVGTEFSSRTVRLSLRAMDGTLLSDEAELVLDSEAEALPDRIKRVILNLNHDGTSLGQGSVKLVMETKKGSAGFDQYRERAMTLRIAMTNLFD